MLKRCSEDGQAVGRELPWALEWEHCWPRPEIQVAAEWHRAAERTEEVKLGLKKIDPSMRGIVVVGKRMQLCYREAQQWTKCCHNSKYQLSVQPHFCGKRHGK